MTTIFSRIGTLINSVIYSRDPGVGSIVQSTAAQFVCEQLERPGYAGNTVAENLAAINLSTAEAQNLLAALLVAVSDGGGVAGDGWNEERVLLALARLNTGNSNTASIDAKLSSALISLSTIVGLLSDMLAGQAAMQQTITAGLIVNSPRGLGAANLLDRLVECQELSGGCGGPGDPVTRVCGDFPSVEPNYIPFTFDGGSQVVLTVNDSGGGLFPSQGSTRYTVVALDLGDVMPVTNVMSVYNYETTPAGGVRPVPLYFVDDTSPARTAQGMQLSTSIPAPLDSGLVLFGRATLLFDLADLPESVADVRTALIQHFAFNTLQRDLATGNKAFMGQFYNTPEAGQPSPCREVNGEVGCALTLFLVAIAEGAEASLGLGDGLSQIEDCFRLDIDNLA